MTWPILIFPIGVVLSWFIRPPRPAAAVTTGVGTGVLAALGVLWFTGAEVSPLETLVIEFGTPIAAVLALKVAEWRLSRGTHP